MKDFVLIYIYIHIYRSINTFHVTVHLKNILLSYHIIVDFNEMFWKDHHIKCNMDILYSKFMQRKISNFASNNQYIRFLCVKC